MSAQVTRLGDAVRALGILLVGPLVALSEIEKPRVIGTGDHTIAAPDAPVLIHYDDAILALVRGLHGTHQCVRRVIAMVTQKRHRLFRRTSRILAFDFDFSDPVNVPSFVPEIRDVIFFSTRVDAGITVR